MSFLSPADGDILGRKRFVDRGENPFAALAAATDDGGIAMQDAPSQKSKKSKSSSSEKTSRRRERGDKLVVRRSARKQASPLAKDRWQQAQEDVSSQLAAATRNHRKGVSSGQRDYYPVDGNEDEEYGAGTPFTYRSQSSSLSAGGVTADEKRGNALLRRVRNNKRTAAAAAAYFDESPATHKQHSSSSSHRHHEKKRDETTRDDSKKQQHSQARKKRNFSERVAMRYDLCANCCEPDMCCRCPEPVRCFIGAIDGHSQCQIHYLISTMYGFVSAISPIDQNWSLTASGCNSFLLAPVGAATITDLNEAFGFDENTRKGDMVLIANVTADGVPIDPSSNIYMITRLPGSGSATGYILRPINWLGCGGYEICEETYIQLRFGPSMFVYIINQIDRCTGNLSLELSNYETWEVAVPVVMSLDFCCQPEPQCDPYDYC